MRNLRASLIVLAGLLTVVTLAPDRAAADDRKLFTGFSTDPYVFILLDTSGSMHWSPKCTQEQFDAGICDYVCPTGDCFVEGSGDSPFSKFYQAKDALYEVIQSIDDVSFGFATYNQDGLYLRGKHWAYTASEQGVTLSPSSARYPQLGQLDVFGDEWNCDSGGGDANIGCYGDQPADLNDPWEVRRVQILPKDEGSTRTFYVRTPGGDRFRIRYTPLDTPGEDTMDVTVAVRRCTNGDCSSNVNVGSTTVTFTKGFDYTRPDPMNPSNTIVTAHLEDFNSWDIGTQRAAPQQGFFTQGQGSDSPAGNTCAGWDPNNDSSDDEHGGYLTRFPTTADIDFPGDEMSVGDRIPLDWRSDQRDDILNRLAPNRLLGESVPDFRTARYFSDGAPGAGGALRLKDEDVRPYVAYGSTPLARSLMDFGDWWEDWIDIAKAEEGTAFDCRRPFLVVLTDGEDTCGPDPCDHDDDWNPGEPAGAARHLYEELGIRTFVVAFGVEASATNSLACMSDEGGTGVDDDINGDGNPDGPGPIYPQNKQELVDALTALLTSIGGGPRTFSAAAVPSVQAEAADKLYLSSLAPIPNQSVWPSQLDAYLKPLPTSNGVPDPTIACPDPSVDASRCHLWEAQDVITTTQVGADPVGPGANQRRLYSEFEAGGDMPLVRSTFENSTNRMYADAEKYDLWRGLGVPFVQGNAASEAAAQLQADGIVDATLAAKNGVLDDGTPISYVVGDVFHSDPIYLTSPPNTLNFIGNINGYRDFFRLHEKRRKMLGAGSNDGMFHVYDAGPYQTSGPFAGKFDNGTGKEIMAYMPRPTLPIAKRLTENPIKHYFSVDGRPTAADVYIDPIHSSVDPIDPNEREWRTVLMGGLRRGGWALEPGVSDLEGPSGTEGQVASGYYLLDVTQPDPIPVQDPADPDFGIPDLSDPPGCLDPAASDCGDVPFGTPLWEFYDTVPGVWDPGGDDRPVAIRLDEDANGEIDLGPTWSTPIFGRMLVCVSPYVSCDPRVTPNSVEERHVAIFGGGLDEHASSFHARGNWLYIVDAETGEAIYKQRLDGAAPSEVAGADVNFDGLLDRLYIGTTLGFLYRVDLVEIVDVATGELAVPRLENVDVDATMSDGSTVTVSRQRFDDRAFQPDILFNANDASVDNVILGIDPDSGEEIKPRQIYFRPSIVFLPELDFYAVAFGTGDREDLFNRDEPSGRFFVFVDDVSALDLHDALAPFDPLQAADLTNIPLADDPLGIGNSLLAPGTGWWFELPENQRVVTEPFALSGVLFFSSFLPSPESNVGEDSLCRESGTSQLFATLITNGDGLLFSSGDRVRYFEAEDLVSSPFTEQSQTKNPPPDVPLDPMSDDLREVMEELKKLFPDTCKFPPGYRVDVKTRTTDTGVVWIAPVPLCVIEKNFKDF
ncbi:MAG: hypothetical protein R2991_13045 [Thermoanaerobaculia bacterium]